MKKSEQITVNEKAYEIYNSAIEEWHKDGESARKKLYSCKAEVIWTIHYEILCSYNTIVACSEKSSGTLVDVLRTEYGYTATSAQHISKFARQYFGTFYDFKKLVARPL